MDGRFPHNEILFANIIICLKKTRIFIHYQFDSVEFGNEAEQS